MRQSKPTSTGTERVSRSLRAGAALLMAFAWVAGCSSGTTGSGADPCQSVYKGKCGNACKADTDCANGLYCGSAGVCTADCAPHARSCAPGFVCSDRGRCEAGTGGDGGLMGIGGGGLQDAAGAACITDSLRGEGIPADIYIMNDQSLSMGCAIPTGGDRWAAMTAAITSFVNSPGAKGLSVGIQYFGLGQPAGMGSCDPAVYTPADVEIAPLPGNAPAIVNSLNAHKPSTYTPTPAAIDGALAHTKAWATAHPSHYVALVLATDGEPNLCGNAQDRIGSVAASAAAAFAGKPKLATYVIGIIGGSAANGGRGCAQDPAPPNKADLDRVAKSGGTNTAFIVDAANGNTNAQFLDALNSIRGAAVVPCQYALPTTTTSGQQVDPTKVNVTFKSATGVSTGLLNAPSQAACDPKAGGWYYDVPNAPTKILLCPATCNLVDSNAQTGIDVLIGCKTNVATTR